MNDAKGMMWADIVGKANVMMKRLGEIQTDGTLLAGNAEVSVASIANMAAADVDKTSTAVLSATGGNANDGKYADAFSTTATVGNTSGTQYKGIPGVVVCLGGTSGCSVSSDGKLSAGWYFTPASPTTYYEAATDDPGTDADESKAYVAEALYASYGHWLTEGTGDNAGEWTVRTFAGSSGGDLAQLAADASLKDDDKATYSGKAAGMSVLTAGSGESATTDSGRFTADVELSATFGSDPKVRGTIDNFVGNAVGSGWEVTLESATLGTGSNNGIATSSGRDGMWNAEAYGNSATKRPAGIFGGFVAHFSNGDAAGAFATRKD